MLHEPAVTISQPAGFFMEKIHRYNLPDLKLEQVQAREPERAPALEKALVLEPKEQVLVRA